MRRSTIPIPQDATRLQETLVHGGVDLAMDRRLLQSGSALAKRSVSWIFLVLSTCGCYDVPFRPPEGIRGNLYIQRGYTSVDRIDMVTGAQQSLQLPTDLGDLGLVDLNLLPDRRSFLAQARAAHVYASFDLDAKLLEAGPWGLALDHADFVTLSPDGSRAAYFDPDAYLVFEDLPSGQRMNSGFRTWKGPPRPAWISEEVVVVHAREGEGKGEYGAWLVDSNTMQATRLEGGLVTCSSYNPSLGAAVCSSLDGKFFELRMPGVKRTIVKRRHGMRDQPCWSPDGRWLAYSRWHDWGIIEGPYGLYVMDVVTGDEIQVALEIADSCFWIE